MKQKKLKPETKENNNNNNNSNRNAKKLTTTTSANKLNTTTNANISARRVNKIRPFIMKMSHLTNNQKAYYINQARTNQTKKLSEIVKNARLRAYRRT